MKLNKRNVDAAAPGDRELFHWDDDLGGFGLRVFPSGRKTFIVKYRTGTGRQRWMTLGTFGELTPDQARRLAKDKLGEVRHGGDPSAERVAERQSATLNDLLDRYEREHLPARNKPNTIAGASRVVRLHLRPALGHLKVAAVTRADVARLHSAMSATPRQANHVVAILSKVFSLAEAWGLRPDGSNPCRKVDRYKETPRDRILSDAELRRLGEAMRAAEGREHPRMLAAILLLLVTGRRVTELCTVRWADVDLERATMRLRETKAGGAQSHALSAVAVRLIGSLDRVPGSPWMLPAPEDPERPLSRFTVGQVWQRVRAAAGLADVTVHDLRHCAGTFAAAGGASAFGVRDFLGHRTVAMTGRYVSRNVGPMRAIAETVGARVLEGLALDVGGPVAVTAAGRFDPAADVLTVRLGEAGWGDPTSDGKRRTSEAVAPLEVLPVFDDAGALVAVEIRGASTAMPALRPAVERAAAVRQGVASGKARDGMPQQNDNLSFAGAEERAAAASDERRAAPPAKKISRQRRAASRKSQPGVVKRK